MRARLRVLSPYPGLLKIRWLILTECVSPAEGALQAVSELSDIKNFVRSLRPLSDRFPDYLGFEPQTVKVGHEQTFRHPNLVAAPGDWFQID